MKTSDFDYELPPELIAQTPVEPRDSSRLLVMRRETGEVEHRVFTQLLDYLRPGDVMVFNQSRVLPARIYGKRLDTGGKVELLLLKRESPGIWQALGKPGRRLRPGAVLIPDAADEGPMPQADVGKAAPRITVLETASDGTRKVEIQPEEDWYGWGETPLPPYIHQRLEDPERYQTIYAKELGSAAAPTAGLHFTPALFDQLRQAGVETLYVTLHVGLDTFRPVHGEDPAEHEIHTEYFEVDSETVARLNLARAEGRRVIAVGTTSVRVLEQLGQDMADSGHSELSPAQGQANLFILPGHQYRVVDAMITNFHLPRSTLLMLVSAFAGRERMLECYREAIQEKYRFYSFGDAMLIV